MANDKVRVFVVDDSSVFVKFLTEGLAAENPRIEIVGYAMNASDAMRKIPSARPDVVTMDVEMPKTNGIEFLKELLPTYLVPVILVSSVNVSVFDALANGAVDFVKKPDMSRNYSAKFFITNLANKVIGASTARVQLPICRLWQCSQPHICCRFSQQCKSPFRRVCTVRQRAVCRRASDAQRNAGHHPAERRADQRQQNQNGSAGHRHRCFDRWYRGYAAGIAAASG